LLAKGNRRISILLFFFAARRIEIEMKLRYDTVRIGDEYHQHVGTPERMPAQAQTVP